MSIISSIYAEHANEVKNIWADKLKEAVKEQDWEKVKKVLRSMQQFYFSE